MKLLSLIFVISLSFSMDVKAGPFPFLKDEAAVATVKKGIVVACGAIIGAIVASSLWDLFSSEIFGGLYSISNSNYVDININSKQVKFEKKNLKETKDVKEIDLDKQLTINNLFGGVTVVHHSDNNQKTSIEIIKRMEEGCDIADLETEISSSSIKSIAKKAIIKGYIDYIIKVPKEQEIDINATTEFRGIKIEDMEKIKARSSSGDISINRAISVVAQASSGDIECSNVTGDVQADSTSGDITIQSAGSVKAEASSGDIACNNVKQDVQVKSSSGDISINGAISVVAQASSGGIKCSNVTGDVQADSTSGDITIQSAGSVKTSASSGEIQITILNPGFKEVTAKTTSGDITLVLPNSFNKKMYTNKKKVKKDKRFNFVEYSSEAAVILETTSGDIKLQ